MVDAVRTHSYTMAFPTLPEFSAFFKHVDNTEYISSEAALSAAPSAARIFSNFTCKNGAGTRW